MTRHTIRGVRFNIDDDGFVTSPLGEIGHVEACEELAELLQSLFDITESIG